MKGRFKKSVKLPLDAFHRMQMEEPIKQELCMQCNLQEDLIKESINYQAIETQQPEKKEADTVLLPFMDEHEFSQRFKISIQHFLQEVRQFHHRQATRLEKQKAQVDEPTAEKERLIHASQLFHEKYKFEARMNGFNTTPVLRLWYFITTNRIAMFKHNSKKYHSRPPGLQRFCNDSNNCELQRLFGWCDLHHIEDLRAGDIIWTKNSDDLWDLPSSMSLVMLGNVESYDIPTIQISRILEVEREQQDGKNFFKAFEKELAILPSDANNNSSGDNFYSTDLFEIQENGKFICSLERLSALYNTNFEIHQLQLLARLGKGSENFLNLLLNGYLPNEIYHNLQCISNKKIHFKTNSITCELCCAWIQQHGPERMWNFLPELVEQNDWLVRDGEKPTLAYSLEELKESIEYIQYVEWSHAFEKPNNIPSHLQLEKNPNVYVCRDMCEIIIWCMRNGGNTSQIVKNETLASWKAK